jgi:hypothetical protein
MPGSHRRIGNVRQASRARSSVPSSSTRRCRWGHAIAFVTVFAALVVTASADVSVSASVDQARVSFGESITYTINVSGAQGGAQPVIPKIDGLSFAGPSMNTSVSIANGAMTQSMSFVYQVTPTRPGEFIIPAAPVNVAGKTYTTEPIRLTVTQSETQTDTSQSLFARVRLDTQQVHLGQTVPLDVVLFSRADVPLKSIGGYSCEADGLGYKFRQNLKSGAKVINGESFNLNLIEGSISPTRTGRLKFGPCILKAQVATQKKSRGGWPFGDSFFDDMMGRVELREQPITLPETSIDVFPLPEEGRPADFAGAVGEWNLEVTAKPTEVAVGDPVTFTVKISGNGNIDTVPMLTLSGLEHFKAYDPTTKTQKNELNTTGERVLQQVLVPKDIEATQLPEVRLAYFDPAAKAYRTARNEPIKLVVKPGGEAGKFVAGATRLNPQEKFGEDIVYLKGDPGSMPVVISWPAFWTLNALPLFGLGGVITWKCRIDRLRGDVAYARRRRAARTARRRLTKAVNFDDIQRALQSYLGDRLNIPASGITASVVEEYRLPADVTGIFERCDAARFAGVSADVTALKQSVERVIDVLERADL